MALTRLLLGMMAMMMVSGSAAAQQVTVWIGTSTPGTGDRPGIYRAAFDTETGAIDEPVQAAEIGSAGFVTLHPDGNRLYAICQLPDGQGGVAAYDIAAETHALRLRNTQPIGGGNATHIAIDSAGRFIFTAQYGGGSVAMFPLADDGSIKPVSALVQHSEIGADTGPDAARQDAPHPHWVGTDPADRFLFVPDLGLDRVVIYRIDRDAARIVPHGSAIGAPGSGPRHMKFHPNGRLAFLLNELDLTVTSFRYDAEAGKLEVIQSISTLPEELREVTNTASEIRIHPNGRFLYAANRGHDSIAAFEVDPASGQMTFIEREAVRGSHPRNFNIDPSGKWLLAAGRDSNTLALFRIEPETGGLVYAGKTVKCPAPICVEFHAQP